MLEKICLIKFTDTIANKITVFDVWQPSEVTLTIAGNLYSVTVRPHTQTKEDFEKEIQNTNNLERQMQIDQKDIDHIGEN